MAHRHSTAVFVALSCLCGSSVTHAAEDKARLTLAAKAAGCDLGKGGGDEPAVALGSLDKSDPALRVLAALTGDMGSDGLGPLCVAVLRAEGGRFSKIAILPPGGAPEPPAEVEPTSTRYIDIDKLAFRFAPNESAFAVRASGAFDSTSTGASWTEFYLFRRKGASLDLIFEAQVEDSETDKTVENGDFTSKTFVVRFSPQMTNGAFDLILAPKGGRGRAKRYVWTGARYVPAKS